MIAAVEAYLAVRRAAGFTLSNTEYLLRSFADFATTRMSSLLRHGPLRYSNLAHLVTDILPQLAGFR
jgi:hypothetical protein